MLIEQVSGKLVLQKGFKGSSVAIYDIVVKRSTTSKERVAATGWKANRYHNDNEKVFLHFRQIGFTNLIRSWKER